MLKTFFLFECCLDLCDAPWLLPFSLLFELFLIYSTFYFNCLIWSLDDTSFIDEFDQDGNFTLALLMFVIWVFVWYLVRWVGYCFHYTCFYWNVIFSCQYLPLIRDVEPDHFLCGSTALLTVLKLICQNSWSGYYLMIPKNNCYNQTLILLLSLKYFTITVDSEMLFVKSYLLVCVCNGPSISWM